MYRRALLGTSVGVVLAGCAGAPMAVLYEVINETDQTRTITVTIETTSKLFDETLLNQTREVEANQAGEFRNPDTDADAHRIVVDVENGPVGSYQWERNPGVTARVYSDRIEIDEDER